MSAIGYFIPEHMHNDGNAGENKGIEMVTIIGIILTDVIVALIFLYYYRKELGLTATGSTD